ncbi:hypothetical protein WICPIJ_001117 [Wickerhamomyces pijperi]|uniref:Exocyst complex component Sec8 n=1 Tax=Wickerhamomyces pijperi TaxID=599730 RepID=A0A9P8QE47_WICPI|nr:hypothetical protein WICPIJ_001117 [Wickerhamomyces pijperi]
MDKVRELQAPSMSTGKRNRALSVTRTTNQQIDRMEKSLDKLQSLLQEIQVDWRQSTQPHANPLEIALPLLDTTSVGLAHRKDEFIDLKDRISNALQDTVAEHYQAFNDSIGSYRTVVQNIANSKNTVCKIRESISDSVKDLEQVTNNEELNTLNENVKNYNEMIAICNAIEYLQKVPNELEACFTDKNYTKAQQILTDVSKKATQYDLWKLQALATLDDYYKTQEQHLFEILIEELLNVVYSKTDFNNMDIAQSSQFKKLQSDYSAEQSLLGAFNIDIGETASQLHSKYEIFIGSFIESQGNGQDVDDFNDNPSVTQFNYIRFDDDSNPFHQILKLLKLIHQSGKLQLALEITTQRVNNEIALLINKVVEDLKLKYPKLIKSLNTSITNNNNNSGTASGANDALPSSADLVLVSELFWNFFRKILFFFQAVKSIIVISETLQPTLKKNVASLELLKLWSLLKDEIEKLILAYISADETNDTSLKTTISNASQTQDSSKLFQFYQVDYNKENSEKLKTVLTNLFPGFVNSKSLAKIDSPYIEDTKFLKQTRVLPANVMNMKYILEPFLLFIQGSNLLILNDRTIDFFNGFMSSKFLPLLEDHFVNLYIEEIEEIHSLEMYEPTQILDRDNDFDEDDSENDKYLLFIVEFRYFFNELCLSLNTASQFRPDFVHILFRIILKFIEKIDEIYKELHNELVSFLEPNKEFILYLLNPSHAINKAKIRRDVINRNEYQNNKIIKNFKYLNNSLSFIIRLLGSNVVKPTSETGKIDINLSLIEKIRKNWYFLEFNDVGESFKYGNLISNDLTASESMKNQTKLTLNDELRLKYNTGIVLSLQKIQGNVKKVLDGYKTILSMI